MTEPIISIRIANSAGKDSAAIHERIIGMTKAGLAPLPLLPILRRTSWCSTTQEYEEYTYCACEEREYGHNCGGPGKHPEFSWKREPDSIARTPADVLRLWPSHLTARGVAIHCGQSRIVVVDADARHGGIESLARLIRDFRLPETWQDDRGDMSPHLYFSEPPGWAKLRLPPSVRLWNYPGIELLSGTHICNVGGSDHEDGVRREWLPGCEAWNPAAIVSVLPDELMRYADQVTPRGSRRSSPMWHFGAAGQRQDGTAAAAAAATEEDQDALRDIKKAARLLLRAEDRDSELRRLLDLEQFPHIEAYRNDTLFKVARSLHWYGADPDDVAETIKLINDLACHEPMDAARIQGVLDSAASYDNGMEIPGEDLENLRQRIASTAPKTKLPLPKGTPSPIGGDGASHKHDGYCSCGYKKRARNRKTGRLELLWFSWGRCDWCIEQRRREDHQIVESGVKQSLGAGTRDFYVSEPFYSRPRVKKKIKVYYVDALGHKVPQDTPGAKKKIDKSPLWYGVVPGHAAAVPLHADKRTAQKMLDEMVRQAGISATIDGDDIARRVRDSGGGTATAFLPDGRRVIFADRPLDDVACRKTDSGSLLAAVKDTLGKCEPRGQGRPMMTFGGTWKPPKKQKEKKEQVLEIQGSCTWTLAEIKELCRELSIDIKPKSILGKIKYRIEFFAPNKDVEAELDRRLSGPSPSEERLGEETDPDRRFDLLWERAQVEMEEDRWLATG